MTEQLQGFKELSKKLTALGQAAGGKALRSATLQASLPIKKQAEALAPVGTVPHRTHKGRLVAPGFTKRSIARKSRLSKDKRRASVLIGVRPEAFYAVQFLELGTSTIPKRPWLTKALEQTRPTVIDRLSERLSRNIKRIASR